MKKDIKLIGLDLDGTLLKEDKTLDEKTVEKLEELGDKGVEIVPITGRPFSGVDDCVRNIKGVNYIITSNGTNIIENKSGKNLFSSPISNEMINEILDILANIDCLYEVFSNHYGYSEENVFSYFKSEFLGTPLGDYIFKSRKCVLSLKEYFSLPNMVADEVFIIAKNGDERQEIYSKLNVVDDLDFIFLADRYLEITKKGIDKGTALEKLCDYLGISLENTIAFGDGENDLKFLKKAGISVAMGNASEVVKNTADLVTLTNEENGVLHILDAI